MMLMLDVDAFNGGGDLLDTRYAMNEEMSTACATYAQWLDDSTQVSAKDLVIYLTFLLLSYSLFFSLSASSTLGVNNYLSNVGVASLFEFVLCQYTSVTRITQTVVD